MSDALLDAALAHGEYLAATAFWSSGQCTWLGRTAAEIDPRSGAVVARADVLDPWMYAGTTGIGLTMAYLARRTSNERWADVARGALRYARERIGRPGAVSPVSFWSGPLGVAVGHVHVGSLLGDEPTVSWGVSTLREVLGAAPDDVPLDVIGGWAGAVLGVLSIEEPLRRRGMDAVDACRVGARQIADAATWSRDECAWATIRATGSDMGPEPLTGFGHGAAGLALALAEVGARTGELDLLETARGARAYEARWFDPAQGNWRDLRRAPQESSEPGFMAAWCHGAFGIGAARLRELALGIGDERARQDANAALETARRILGAVPPDADSTLCHGWSGAVDLLIEGSVQLGRPALMDEAREAVLSQVNRERHPTAWPCGVPSRRFTPSLMVGTAGVAHTLLRLSSSGELPSVARPGAISPD